jgi:hypothetical protein
MRLATKECFVFCITMLVGLLVSGCGSTGAENAALARTALKASDARLKIFRAETLIGAAGAARVKVDGREVANLGVGGSTMRSMSPPACTKSSSIIGGIQMCTRSP